MRIPTAVVAAGSIGVLLAMTFPGSASAATAHRIAGTATIGFTSEDLGAKGLTPGDRLSYTVRTTDKAGKKIGDGGGDCVLVSGHDEKHALYQCTETDRFGAATLTVTGLYDAGATGRQHWSITGGTGRYENAHGVEDFKALTANTFDALFRFST